MTGSVSGDASSQNNPHIHNDGPKTVSAIDKMGFPTKDLMTETQNLVMGSARPNTEAGFIKPAGAELAELTATIDETASIIKDQPDLKGAVDTILTGLNSSMTGISDDPNEANFARIGDD